MPCDSIYQKKKIKKNIYEVGYTCNKQNEGKWTRYKNDKIIGIVYYENGAYNGTNTYYNENGVIIMTLQFKNGALDGEARFFSSEGSLLAIYLYENNIRGKIQFYVIDDESPSKEHNYKPDF